MADILHAGEIVQAIREQSDETNQKTKDDESIVRVLNRGQRIATSILAVRYPEPLLAESTIALTAGTSEYDVPEDAYEDRAVYVVFNPGGNAAAQELHRRDFRDVAWMNFSSSDRAPPMWWVSIGRKIRLVPTPAGGSITVTYVRRPPKIVLPQGRITAIGDDYVVIDQGEAEDHYGNDLTSESDRLGSYVNIVNWETGAIRAAFQIQNITDGRVTLKPTPIRSTVRGQAISGSASLATCGADFDDFVCLSEGSCVPFLQGSLVNHLIEYGVSRMRLSLDGQAQFETAIAQAAEEGLESQYHGREPADRVRASAPQWPTWGGNRWRPVSGS